jgi:hypothetical protein
VWILAVLSGMLRVLSELHSGWVLKWVLSGMPAVLSGMPGVLSEMHSRWVPKWVLLYPDLVSGLPLCTVELPSELFASESIE